jgi:hypothetical protein
LNRSTYLLVPFLATLFFSVQGASATDWTIVPGKRFGPINRDMGEREVIGLFGAQNVTHSEFPVAEGLTSPATTLFPDDPEKTAFILWQDPTTRQSISNVFVRGERTAWRTDRGITLGTSLRALENMNGKPVFLAGFGWDYGGTIYDCNGGRLTFLGVASEGGTLNRTLTLRVAPHSSARVRRQ